MIQIEITFKTQRLGKTFSSDRGIRRAYGDAMATVIRRRLRLLGEAPTLTQVPTTPPERRHLLSGRREGQYAIDLRHPYRLIFEPYHAPIPLRADGGVDTDKVTTITIVEIIDYH